MTWLVVGLVVLLAGVPVRGASAAQFQFNILAVEHTAPGESPKVTFSVTDPSTGDPYNIKTDPAFTAGGGASRLFVQIGWDTRDYTNTGSGQSGGAALPIAINALASSTIDNTDGTFTVESPRPLPGWGHVKGTGVVAVEGHPAGLDADGHWTVRVPVKSVFKPFPITDSVPVPRRKVVDIAKCDVCHGQLTMHGNNRTDEPQVCVICHNPNQTDISQRWFGDPAPQFGTEESVDFKRLVHGIHAGGKRKTPLIVFGFNHSTNDFSGVRFPATLSNCYNCHVDRTKASGESTGVGTFELPLAKEVLGTTIDTGSTLPATCTSAAGCNATKVIDTDPTNDLKITPIAAACTGCHDDPEKITHMIRKGRAQFGVTQAAIDASVAAGLGERCKACHGRGKDKDVRKAHEVRQLSGTTSGSEPED